MELLRLGAIGEEIPAVRHDGVTRDLRSLTDDIDGAFLAADGVARVREAIETLPVLEGADDLRIGAPIAKPGAVLCIGMNYAAHAAESGGTPPSVPILFFKHPNTVVGPFDDVPLPPGSTKLDWEVELGVVISKRASYLSSPEEAWDHIAGFVTSQDLSERAWQIEESGGQWSKGKCGPSFNPLGPSLVPVSELADAHSLRLWSTVNGEARQDSTTADMIFDVATIVHDLSQYLTLDPGDLINTGTPEGVALSGRFPYLAKGDVIEIGIEGLGRQKQTIV
jgi:2,4-diketo-3-deoxy-L-fuconate hydrolase